MTRPEFMGQFQRLCVGFKYEFTPEQAEAWFRRIGHVEAVVWSETVTNLLCSDRFPRDLDRVLLEVDKHAQAARAKAILRDRPRAARIHEALGGDDSGIDPTLFQVIKAYAGREQVQRMVGLVTANDEMNPTVKRLRLVQLRTEEARLNAVIKAGIPSLTNDDALRLMHQYESVEVA